MIILRSTMEAAVDVERAKIVELARTYGEAVRQTAALQKQLGDWITDKGEQLTPEQFAALLYSHDDRWQAMFFNCLSSVIEAYHASLPPAMPNEYRPGPGYPAGEGQWCWMADHIDDSGFATLEAMFEHAKSARERRTVAA